MVRELVSFEVCGKRYQLIFCKVLQRELYYWASMSRNIIDLKPLQQGLHQTPDILRRTLQAEIDAAQGEPLDAILLGYGLCCNGTEGLVSPKLEMVIPRAHDCITLLLGSKERYREYFDQHPGTYWYSVGWIENASHANKERYDQLKREYVEKYGEDNADYLMQCQENWMKEYKRATFVDTGFDPDGRYREYTRQCAESLGWEYDELRGDGSLLSDLLEGRWDTERFLVMPPGERIKASYAESTIVRACCTA